jgi:hypothetical protein
MQQQHSLRPLPWPWTAAALACLGRRRLQERPGTGARLNHKVRTAGRCMHACATCLGAASAAGWRAIMRPSTLGGLCNCCMAAATGKNTCNLLAAMPVRLPDHACACPTALAPAGDTTISNDRSSQPSAAASSQQHPQLLQPSRMVPPVAPVAGFPLPLPLQLPLLGAVPPWQAIPGQPGVACMFPSLAPMDIAAGAGSHLQPAGSHAPAAPATAPATLFAAAGSATLPPPFADSAVMGESQE